MSPTRDHYGLVLTTTTAAARHYRDGANHLLSGTLTRALHCFEIAMTHNPGFALGQTAVYLTETALGNRPNQEGRTHARDLAAQSASRRERQHVEILIGLIGTDQARAVALGHDHLREYPVDLLVFLAVSSVSPATRDDLTQRLAPAYGGDPIFWNVARGVTILNLSPPADK
jgi:hypothetical protein